MILKQEVVCCKRGLAALPCSDEQEEVSSVFLLALSVFTLFRCMISVFSSKISFDADVGEEVKIVFLPEEPPRDEEVGVEQQDEDELAVVFNTAAPCEPGAPASSTASGSTTGSADVAAAGSAAACGDVVVVEQGPALFNSDLS